ncbi:MAG: transporter substrate-binding domain-containing protein, partial [Kordiimonadaceae bacterium]|nr:transporter substrate-binding domain-containing protein [Kordiimonadaceae bacterium]
NKKIDIIHSISENPERSKFLSFSPSYVNFPYVYFGRTDAEAINSIDDLNGKRIGVIKGWATTLTYQNDYPHLNLIEQNNATEALTALSAGVIDVFILQLPIGNYLIAQNFISNVKVIGTQFFPKIVNGDNLQFGIRKDWPVLTQIIKKANAVISVQEKQSIANKWLTQYNFKEDIGLTEEELNWLSTHKTVFVAIDSNSPPIEFINSDGKISGMAGAYLDFIAEKLEINFEWIQNKTLAEGFEKIKSSQADMLAAVTANNERKKYLSFSDRYLTISNVIYARTDNATFGSLEGLAGRKVAQVKGFASAEYIRRNHPDIEIVEVNNITEALLAVNKGKADAYVGSIPSAASIIASKGLVQIDVVGETPFKPRIGLATRSNLPLLASAIQKVMKSITPSEHAEISRKWLVLNINKVDNYQLIWKIASAAAVLIFIILIWNNSLRREVNRRKEAEKNMLISQERAEKSNAAKSVFLANMSHEIRTPLNAIIGFSEVMSSRLFGKIENPKYVEYLNDINESGKHLATVINDILDLSKIEAGKWQLKEEVFFLDDCINSSMKMFDNLAEQKDIELSYSTNGSKRSIKGDQHCIKRAIINLFSNALKFTKNGGKTTCTVSDNNDGSTVIEIADTGIGIPKDRLDHVTNPFGQIHDDQHLNEEGTGLGLSIVSNLVELHQGTFLIESELGVGTKAIIVIPPERKVA